MSFGFFRLFFGRFLKGRVRKHRILQSTILHWIQIIEYYITLSIRRHNSFHAEDTDDLSTPVVAAYFNACTRSICYSLVKGYNGYLRVTILYLSTWQSSRNTVWSTSLSHFIRSENGARSLWQDRCFGIHSSLECCTTVSISVPCKRQATLKQVTWPSGLRVTFGFINAGFQRREVDV